LLTKNYYENLGGVEAVDAARTLFCVCVCVHSLLPLAFVGQGVSRADTVSFMATCFNEKKGARLASYFTTATIDSGNIACFLGIPINSKKRSRASCVPIHVYR